MQSTISNDYLKVVFDDQTEPQIVPKLLPNMYVREIYNILVSDTTYGGLKGARDEENDIIISDSALRTLFPPQLKNISARYKVMCGCECCISDKSVHASLLSRRDWYLKNSNIKEKMIKTEGLMKEKITHMKHIKIQ